MKLIETTISETAVRMRYADNADPSKATAWIDFRVPISGLTLPSSGGPENNLGDPEIRYLAEVRQGALRYVRDVIGEETQRLARLKDQKL